ncbi:MAG: protein kinase [Acidobacteriota bacterium]
MIFQRDHARDAEKQLSKGNFEKAARSFVKAKRFDRAAEIYRDQLKDVDRAVEIYLDQGLDLKAAELLDAEGRREEAIRHYDRAKAYRSAAEASLALGRHRRAGTFYEKAQMFDRAAECFTAVGEVGDALRVLEKEGDLRRTDADADPVARRRLRQADLRRADLLENLGRQREAARLLVSHGETERAARLYESLEAFAEAAEAYLAAGREDDALAMAEQAEEIPPELRAEIYLEVGKAYEAAGLLEQIGRVDAAAAAYESAGAVAKAASLWEQEGSFSRAADLYYRVERHYDAGRCFAKAEQHERAGDAFARASAFARAADAFANADRPMLAGDYYLEAGQDADAVVYLSGIEERDPDYPRASLLLAPLLLERGRREDAARRLELVKKISTQFDRHELFYCFARSQEADGQYSRAKELYSKVLSGQKNYRDAEQRLRRVMTKETRDDTPSLTLRDTGLIGAAGPSALRAAEATGAHPAQQETGNRTREVDLDPSPASTGTMPKAVGAAPVGTETQGLRAEREPTGEFAVPAAIESRVGPWWSGADFFRVIDHTSSEPMLMVSFPLAAVTDQVEGFKKVMRQVEALQHPAMLKLQATQQWSDKVLLFYEFFEGQSLQRALDQGRRLGPLEALRLVLQLCEALTNAHKLGVTHQWLSPHTVLVDDGARCKVAGIGLRKFLHGDDPTSQDFLSPEVAEDGPIGPTSDVFSLGRLSIELLGAYLPMGWNKSEDLDPESVRWPEEVREKVPPALRAFLVRCLAHNPLDRPSTAEMAAALTSVGLIEGQVLSERYEIQEEIGRGGMSKVYRARDLELDDEVAIKTVLAPALGRTEDEDRLHREVQISRRISHPNVVRVHDIGRFPGGIFIIMELLVGPGLDEVIREQAPLPAPRVKEIMTEIAKALGEAHRLKIVHRDLKPGNVILVNGRAKVLDFGIARMADGRPSDLTRTGEVIGSPLYMAPEQIQGVELDGTCDLYALGVIAYTLLSGREPFTGDSPTAVVLKHLHEPPPDILEYQPGLDPAWIEVLAKLLEKRPADRYQDADALLAALDRLPE